MADYWDKIIPVVEARLAGHGKKFIAGTDRPTIADFKCFQNVIHALPSNSACVVPANVQAQLEAKFTASAHFGRWVEAMKVELASYISTRPARPL